MGEVVTLDDVCELIVDCKNRTPPECPAEEAYGFAVGTPNIRDGRIVLESAKRVNRETFATWTARAVPQADDLIVTREAPVGRVGIIPEGVKICLGQRTMLLRANAEIVHPRFLHYLLMGPDMQQAMHALSSGSTVPHLKVGEVRNLKLPPLPSLMQQRMIGELLGALDDEIAVNEWIARTSLDLADAHFELVTRDLAYSSETFGSVAEVFGGGTPRTSEPAYWDGPISWATPSDVTGLSVPYLFTTARKITEKGLAECASQLYPPGSIFMTSRATIGAFAVPQVPTAVNQGFIVVIPRQPEMRWWLFHEMRSRVDEMRSLANGSTLLGLSREDFKAMRVRLAEPDVIARFSAQVDPLHKQAAKCAEESHTLAQLRDTLLPKLMSGELRVRDAEKAVEESARLEKVVREQFCS